MESLVSSDASQKQELIEVKSQSGVVSSVKSLIGTPNVIFTSDLHLGGGDTLHDEFKDFLSEIMLRLKADKEFRNNLKAIVFLGDVFDMIMDGTDDIILKHSDIFDVFQKLYDMDIKLIFALGNHEISVTGNYHKRFEKRMKLFFNEVHEAFAENFFAYSWFNKDYFCQYVIVHAIPNKKITLNLYHSMDQIKKGKPTLQLEFDIKFKADKQIVSLGCHGFQYPRFQTQLYGSTIWNMLLSLPSPLKTTVNTIWNESGIGKLTSNAKSIDKEMIKEKFELVKEKLIKDEPDAIDDDMIKNIDVEEDINEDIDEDIDGSKGIMSKTKNKLNKAMNKVENWFSKTFTAEDSYVRSFFRKIKEDTMKSDTVLNMISNLMVETQEKFMELTNDDTKITDFLKLYDLDQVTHIIYGHTHKKGVSEKDGVMIYNTGAWQHTPDGSIVCFYADGEFKLF